MADRSGQQLGNYRLVRLIGQGGFAEVYLGEHIYLKTPVAIKVLHAQLTSDNMEDFLKEARTIAHLRHPNIVRVLEFGIEDKMPFLAMDYAPHGTLRQRHSKGARLPLSLIVPYVKQVASALQYAHEQRLIHRDIKPENMLLGDRDEILLSDFGIALVAESSRVQGTQEVVGTVAYMSPEQIQGKPRPASDQYSLAVVVYEWLSGDRPFHGSFTELCTQHIFAPPPPLRERVPRIAPEVEQVVSRALAKDYHQRFMSIQAFANALEESYQLQQETFVKPPTSAQLVTPPPRSPSAAYIPPMQASASSHALSSDRLSNNYVAEPETVMSTNPVISTGPELAVEIEREEKAKVWNIGRRQVVAMLAGAVLFAALFFLSNYFDLIDPAKNASIALAWATLLFVGTVFGPWAGLVTGGGGLLLTWAFTSILQSQPILDINLWRQDLGFATTGLIAGLSLYMTKGRYNNFQALAAAGAISIVAAFIGTYITYFPSIIVDNIVSFLPSLVLLPILLGIYNAIASRRK